VSSVLCLYVVANFPCVCTTYVMVATGRNFFSILDCKPVLERSSNYLEVLFLFFPSFYFLRYFFDILGVLKAFF